ncbi:MAG: AAA family ATPase, partial [Clostridiales bacterium]|nr:AAA family ATPase [Clostridiales bacterium]
MDSIKINKLELENVKRIKAVKIEPTKNGLTVIGGNNAQGKTSVLDAIAWALGGEKYKPSMSHREGSVLPPTLHLVLSNGLVVERKGKNSSLKVIDPEGNKGGQQLLNEFIEQLALDLPKFMESSSTEKAKTLLSVRIKMVQVKSGKIPKIGYNKRQKGWRFFMSKQYDKQFK